MYDRILLYFIKKRGVSYNLIGEEMGRLKELIDNFIQPKNQQTFEELALAAGLNQSDLKQLKNTKEGISWSKFAREDESTKKEDKSSKVISNKGNEGINKISQERKITKKSRSNDLDREQ